MTAEVGPAHQRAREFLARAAGDETYGKLVDENFDAGAFADEIIQRDRQRSLDDTGPSAAVAAVDAVKETASSDTNVVSQRWSKA